MKFKKFRKVSSNSFLTFLNAAFLKYIAIDFKTISKAVVLHKTLGILNNQLRKPTNIKHSRLYFYKVNQRYIK